jgi:hypothetical protein
MTCVARAPFGVVQMCGRRNASAVAFLARAALGRAGILRPLKTWQGT